jgi:Rrf2 family protein
MKLSRTVDYALRATLMLAQQQSQRPIPCSQLAQQGEMPERFLLQILRSLVNHGILRSTRGVDGGYALVRPARDVSVLQVIEAIEGPLCEGSENHVDAGSKHGSKNAAQVELRSALRGVSQSMCRELDAIKIAQLLPPPVKQA